jgi:hypothetical protein
MRKLVALAVAPVVAGSIALAPAADAATATSSSLQLPDVTQIVNCTIGLVEQLLFTGRPAPDCFGVP